MPVPTEAVLDQMADPVIYAGRGGKIQLWNRAAASLFEYEAGEAMGTSIDIIVPERLRKPHWRGFEAAMASGMLKLCGRPTLTRALHKDGSRLYIEMSFALVKNHRRCLQPEAFTSTDHHLASVMVGVQKEMPLQNRVTPNGEIVAATERGTLMGNRGCLHKPDQTLGARRWATRAWVTCLLSYRGRRRQLMRPGYYTELFFLDSATAFAAGHRPCGECRRECYRKFVALWAAAKRLPAAPKVSEIDRQLHIERLGSGPAKVTFAAGFGDLPDGVMVSRGTDAFLKWDQSLRPWSLSGYGAAIAAQADEKVTVLTPMSVVEVMKAGYRPSVHPSATGQSPCS